MYNVFYCTFFKGDVPVMSFFVFFLILVLQSKEKIITFQCWSTGGCCRLWMDWCGNQSKLQRRERNISCLILMRAWSSVDSWVGLGLETDFLCLLSVLWQWKWGQDLPLDLDISIMLCPSKCLSSLVGVLFSFLVTPKVRQHFIFFPLHLVVLPALGLQCICF